MALFGETGHIGKTCSDCKTVLIAKVLISGGGFYIGTYCDCGPFSRESLYYSSREEAQTALDNKTFSR
jgi:hypothetical protein